MNQASNKSEATNTTDNEPLKQKKIPFWRVMLSVIQAGFGVQNSKNRERDFTQGKLLPFIVAALIFTVCFVLAVMLAVNLALN